jgi:hypothetical protein
MGIADFPVGYIQPTIRGSKRRVVVRVFVPVGPPLSSIAQPTIYRDLPRNYPDGEINWLQALGELPCLLAREFVH